MTDTEQIHVEDLIDMDVEEHHAIIQDLGEELLKRKMWTNALNCFAVIHSCPSASDILLHVEMGWTDDLRSMMTQRLSTTSPSASMRWATCLHRWKHSDSVSSPVFGRE